MLVLLDRTGVAVPLFFVTYSAVAMERPNQKALLVRVAGDSVHGLTALNEHLSNGWRVIETSPLGGGHATETVALVIIEQQRSADTQAMPVAERQAQPAEDDIMPEVESPVEGDGATPNAEPGDLDIDVASEDPAT